jgi:hypothetical protein
MGKTENGIDTDILGQSAAHAWRAAMGLSPLPFEHLSIEDEERWLRLGKNAEEFLGALVDARFNQVGMNLARLWARSSEPLTLKDKEQLAWEATARHMATLLDADQMPRDLEKLEQSWGPWTVNRLPKEQSDGV